jgi:hypothetical protein
MRRLRKRRKRGAGCRKGTRKIIKQNCSVNVVSTPVLFRKAFLHHEVTSALKGYIFVTRRDSYHLHTFSAQVYNACAKFIQLCSVVSMEQSACSVYFHLFTIC